MAARRASRSNGGMNRESGLLALRERTFDVAIVGGGATGLGCALDAASRGYATALIEARDFASATSSRSTKLVHGGVRYLQQGNIALVREALLERARLRKNAPNLVRPLAFVVPAYSWPDLPYYAAGLRLYDALAREHAFAHSRVLSARAACEAVPALQHERLCGGVLYYDAQFDDARLAIALAQSAVDAGAALANYVRAGALIYDDARHVCGVSAIDDETGERIAIRARAVINATGIFADRIRALDDPAAPRMLRFSRGSHIVVSSRALPLNDAALLVPRTPDGRVVFAIPWHGRVLAGTTDVATGAAEDEPQADRGEIAFLLAAINRYVRRPIAPEDILSVFAGLRPLIDRGASRTARLSREHALEVSKSGLVTIAGGKWTTYRKMAEDAVDAAQGTAHLAPRGCRTANLKLRDVPLEPDAVYAAQHEMARTLEDVLARRSRALFVDAESALKQAAVVASELAHVLGREEAWRREQVRSFEELALRYRNT
jgi:glycerol-3-phosphate dehydrogenase